MEENGIFRSLTAETLMELFACSCDGFFLMNENFELRHANHTMLGWLGIDSNSSTGINLYDVVAPGAGRDTFVSQCNLAGSGTPCKFSSLFHPAGVAPRWLEISLQWVDNRHYLCIARDIGNHRDEIKLLHYRASHDELTGLPNRTAIMRVLHDMPRALNGRERALVIIELQHFNIINDICGLAAGDEILMQVAGIIREGMHKRDLAARMGGKKFLLLCNDCTLDQAYSRAWTLRDRIAALGGVCNGSRHDIGVSIGISTISHEADCVEAVSEADAASQYARSQGTNRIHTYTPNSNNSYRQQESEWISRIATAFEDGRFRLFFQKIKQAEGGESAGNHREILLRMVGEDGQHISPEAFIPPAEKYNLMPLIDRWVIRTLFTRHAASWRIAQRRREHNPEHPQTLCCINLSGASLNDDYFPEFLHDQVTLHNVPAQAVCFEITETVAVKDLQKASRLISRLREEGFRFALDDFGKGMSSFAYLRSLPVDFLKIDGSLVKNIDVNRDDLRMVEAINHIAQGMGIKTIAEYVKNQAMIDMLVDVGVDFVQGYGIHHPEPLH